MLSEQIVTCCTANGRGVLRDGCPLQPGSSLQKVLHLTPSLTHNRDKRGVALDGQLKRSDTTLASTTL